MAPLVHVSEAFMCTVPVPVSVCVSTVGRVIVRSVVTVVVPFMRISPLPLNDVPAANVT